MPDADYSYTEPNDRYEIIDGVKYPAIAASLDHDLVVGNIFYLFTEHFRIHRNGLALARVDVHLPDGNLCRPDIAVVCDTAPLKGSKIFKGVPDLAVEVLSHSTMKNDLGIKMTLYARNGVREYWIIDRWSKHIDVYRLDDGIFALDDVYWLFTEAELAAMDEQERSTIKSEIKVSIVPDLAIDIREIFKFWWDSSRG